MNHMAITTGPVAHLYELDEAARYLDDLNIAHDPDNIALELIAPE